jgi:protein-tyrosine phosphatase
MEGFEVACRSRDAFQEEFDWSRIERVIFACKGNLCRSPYAEARARQMGLNAASVGVIGIPDKPAEPMALRAALLCGVDMSDHRSNSLESLPPSPSDLILCMDPSIQQAVKAAWPECAKNVTLLGLWDPLRPRLTIADPFGGHLELFFGSFEIIDRCIGRLAQLLGARRQSKPASEGAPVSCEVPTGTE